MYEGKTLFVKYEGITPFGLKENYDKDGNYQGTSMQINCEDEYLEKARELDQFFIEAFYKNKWSLNKNVPIGAIEGYEYGEFGLWKRICKKPYKVNEGGIREYLDYPCKMEFAFLQSGETKIVSPSGEKLDSETEIGPLSRVKFIAAWFSLSRGTFGLTLQPKLMQIMSRERENVFDQCLLEVDEDEKDEYEKDEDEENVEWS